MDMVTVYRSWDSDADLDASAVRELLVSAGLEAVVLDDKAPGVISGAFEVQVPAEQAARAEELLAANKDAVEQHVDTSHDLDLVTIFSSEANATAEVEAVGIKGVLDAAGIDAVLMSNTGLPNLAFEIRVAAADAERAQQVLAEARAAGPAAAEQGARESQEAGVMPPEA